MALERLLLVRHGQSAGNVARDAALADGLGLIDIALRDCDVPLSQLGERQSRALGRWLAHHEQRPHVVLTSPYVRAQETAALALQSAGWNDIAIETDERLREKEFGILDRLTRKGIQERYPEQAEMRSRLGKFYYRPPGGESWTDVILRLRSLLESLKAEHAPQRVTVVSHQVVVLCFRYLLESLDEKAILAIDALGDVANCSITSYRSQRRGGAFELESEKYNAETPLREAGEPVTRGPDAPVAPK